MGKFAIECPKCGALNMAATGLWAKKMIKCVTCSEDINVEKERMSSRICPHCGKTFIFDLAKGREQKCPCCEKKVNAMQAEKRNFIQVNCPQCSCLIQIDGAAETYQCPICKGVMDVKKQIARSKLVKENVTSILQYEGDNSTFVWKHPIEDFNYGSQLIVHESQEAMFFLNGRALDLIDTAGVHVLQADSLPALKGVSPKPEEGKKPFHAEVYFINKTVDLQLPWGTNPRVNYYDPETKQSYDIGFSGEMYLRVSDSRKLLLKLVGTTGGLTDKDILGAKNDMSGDVRTALRGFFRTPMLTVLRSYLSSALTAKSINVYEIEQQLDVLSEILREKISPIYEEYGLTVPHFYVLNVSYPQSIEEEKARMAKKHKQSEDDRAAIETEATKRARILEEKKTEIELKKFELEMKKIEAEMKGIESHAEADAAYAEGHVQTKLMEEQGISGKDILEAKVKETEIDALKNTRVNIFDVSLSGNDIGKNAEWTCPHCGEKGNKGKFCPNCSTARPE